jgi:hypothetical protein
MVSRNEKRIGFSDDVPRLNAKQIKIKEIFFELHLSLAPFTSCDGFQKQSIQSRRSDEVVQDRHIL